MKKGIVTTVIAVIFLLATLLTFTACSPYETFQSLTQKMEDTQKYTMNIVMDITQEDNGQEMHGVINISSAIDGDKIHTFYEINSDDDVESNATAESYMYPDGDYREMMARNSETDEWTTYLVPNTYDGLEGISNYLTTDFDWNDFNEENFDQEGNTLILKEDKYVDFFPFFADYIDYFKVTTGFNQFSIEYSISYDLYVASFEVVVTMSITDIGTTTVTIPEID
ncbi:MAG TPA: hypothetical protein P5087_05805 [Eubacteriales bacterium]|nr:hypothetical protein [Eubacteriales bacterium]